MNQKERAVSHALVYPAYSNELLSSERVSASRCYLILFEHILDHPFTGCAVSKIWMGSLSEENTVLQRYRAIAVDCICIRLVPQIKASVNTRIHLPHHNSPCRREFPNWYVPHNVSPSILRYHPAHSKRPPPPCSGYKTHKHRQWKWAPCDPKVIRELHLTYHSAVTHKW